MWPIDVNRLVQKLFGRCIDIGWLVSIQRNNDSRIRLQEASLYQFALEGNETKIVTMIFSQNKDDIFDWACQRQITTEN